MSVKFDQIEKRKKSILDPEAEYEKKKILLRRKKKWRKTKISENVID